jgi:dipeptidase D
VYVRFLVLFAFLALSPSAFAVDIWERLKQSPENTVFILFEEISNIYRPSGEEAQIEQFVRNLAAQAGTKVWSGRAIETVRDNAGNLLLRLPGTGRYAASAFPIVGVQSHFDMVTVTSLEGDDVANVFRNGVRSQITDGWMHSEGHRTTLGADNGIGMALALRYLVDPSLEHPPMELIFTTREEVSMVGAKAMQLPLNSSVIVNVDEEDVHSVCHGCLGARRVKVETSLPTEKMGADMDIHKFTIQKLAGGHSGVDIHRNRINAARLLSEMIRAMRLRNLNPRLASVQMGKIGNINGIPSSITFELVTPASKSHQAWSQISALFNAALAKSPDDKGAELKMAEAQSHNVDRRVLSSESTETLSWFLKDVPNGVIASADGFPERVKSSSNLGYIEMAASGEQMQVQLAAMPRSFDNKDLDAIVDQIRSEAQQHFPNPETKVETYARTSPWLADPQDPIFTYARHHKPGSQLKLAPGGVETAVLAEKYPDIRLLSVGPTFQDVHTVNERVRVADIFEIQHFLDRFLQNVDSCHFLLVPQLATK